MPGVAVSLLLFTVGAILDFAVTVSPYQHGFNINNVGIILMIVGAVGFVLSIVFWTSRGGGWYGGGGFGPRRRRTIVDDSRGNVVRREDVFE